VWLVVPGFFRPARCNFALGGLAVKFAACLFSVKSFSISDWGTPERAGRQPRSVQAESRTACSECWII